MKMVEACLPCLVNQAVKVANMTHAQNRELLYHQVFRFLSTADFSMTSPEIIGCTFRMLKGHIHNDDPYQETRNYYNDLFLKLSDQIEDAANQAADPFKTAVKYAIIGNIIDFNPVHNITLENVMAYFKNADHTPLTIDCTDELLQNLRSAKSLLYLGDNCGEICLDKLLLKRIKASCPNLHVRFGVRGRPVVNDSIEADAVRVGIPEYAEIINNGDDSLGTVLHRTSPEFQAAFHSADVIIAKGQANYECLSSFAHKNLYFLLMTKCSVIAEDIGVPVKSLVCMRANTAAD